MCQYDFDDMPGKIKNHEKRSEKPDTNYIRSHGDESSLLYCVDMGSFYVCYRIVF